MRIYKTKWFHRWAAKEGLTEAVLCAAAVELERGLGDALGGYVYKKRARSQVAANAVALERSSR